MDGNRQATEAYTAYCRVLEVYLQERNIDGLMELVTEDVVSVGTGVQEIAMGKEALQSLYTREVRDLPLPISYEVRNYWESRPAEGVYNCFADVEARLEVEDKAVVSHTRLTMSLVKTGGKLLVSHLHMSVPDREQEESEFLPVQKALSEELLFNNEVCGVVQYRLYPDSYILIERLNREAARIMRIPQKDILSRKLLLLETTVHSTDESLVVEGRQGLEVGESTEPGEYRMRGQDGTFTWVAGYSTALDEGIDEGGHPYKQLHSVFIDIDDKKKSELELQEYTLNQHLASYRKDMTETLRGFGLGFWYVKEDPKRGPMITMDEAASDAVAVAPGTDPAEAYAEVCRNVYAEDIDAFAQYYVDIRDNGRAECTYRYNHKDRGLRYIRCSGWWDGQQRRGFHMDVTEQVEKERQYQKALEESNAALKEALASARHANEAKTRFLSNMSHDIRTPLNAIIGFATIAAGRSGDAQKVRDCLTKILSSSEHLLGLINDILDMSRIESGKTTVECSKTTISEIARNVMSLIQPQIQSKQINFYVDTLDIRDEYIFADTLKMRQILLNILGNAVKFTRAEGTVSIKIIQMPGSPPDCGDYRFIIKDNGNGMSEEFIERIFEPFEREKNSTISGITGTGLGMAITKNLIDMMGGSISVRSKPGEGSEFTVDLRFQLQPDAPREQRIEELEGLRVLVVDDDFQTCESITRMLGNVGMRSDWTTVAREALHRVQMACSENDRFYAYVIDWIMPEMNGIELTRRIRRIVGDETPIIILTAYDWEEIADEAREAGVTAFCTKPLFISDLTKVLLNRAESTPRRDDVCHLLPHDRRRILLAEDNELNQEIAIALLEEKGLLVDAADNGAEALEMLEASQPGYYRLVLMDIQMPVMDGYEATKRIRMSARQDLREIPVIAMTANAFQEDRDAAIASGMNDHLAKPFNMQKVVEVITSYLS